MLLSPTQLKMEARYYQHHDVRREELESQMVEKVIKYLKTDKIELGQNQHYPGRESHIKIPITKNQNRKP